MHMVAYDNLRPSLSKNCMDSVRDLYERCTSDDQSMRPTFEEIVQFLENDVRKETLVRAVRVCLSVCFCPACGVLVRFCIVQSLMTFSLSLSSVLVFVALHRTRS